MKILYLSPINWGDLKQRPQHIAEELSKDNTVIYVEPSISFLTGLVHRNQSFKKRHFKIHERLEVIRLSGLWRLPKSGEVFDFLGINNLYEKLKLKKYIKECDVIWLGSPIYYPFVSSINNKKIIYDLMDDYVQLTTNKMLKRLLRKYEFKLLQRADTVFASSQNLFNIACKSNHNVHLVRNAVDDTSLNIVNTNHIVKQVELLRNHGQVVFGYVGAIDHWFDYEVIQMILDHSNKFTVILVGRNNMKEKRIVSPNVIYYDPIPKEEVFNVIRSFDVCLYPFKIDDFINSINPVKIYEYLSCNKVTIAAESDEISKFAEQLNIYRSHDELKHLLGDIYELHQPFNNEKNLGDFLNKNNWQSRAKKILEYISKERRAD